MQSLSPSKLLIDWQLTFGKSHILLRLWWKLKRRQKNTQLYQFRPSLHNDSVRASYKERKRLFGLPGWGIESTMVGKAWEWEGKVSVTLHPREGEWDSCWFSAWFFLLCHLGPQPREWCCPHSGRVFPLLLNLAGNNQRWVSMVIINLVKLTAKINHHSDYDYIPHVAYWCGASTGCLEVTGVLTSFCSFDFW